MPSTVTFILMINNVRIKNFGPIQDFNWDKLGQINVILGENGSGKTIILKAIYSALKAFEMHKRGDEKRDIADLLQEKLYWTFQVDKIGDLVTRGSDSPLLFNMISDFGRLRYSFGKDTEKRIRDIEPEGVRVNTNSIFFPAKEVLTNYSFILHSRDVEQSFGYDDTYYDLAVALRAQTTRGRNYDQFSEVRGSLSEMINGYVDLNEATNRWVYSRGKSQFSMGVTAEGIKKIAILDRLLGNRYLNRDSIIFIDEPESALHPKYIDFFMDVAYRLSQRGIQIFIATHSYFVIKKLALISAKSKFSMPVAICDDVDKNQWRHEDLVDGMPDNQIIQESIRLYEEEIFN